MEPQNGNNLNNTPEKVSIKTISLKDLWNVLRGCLVFVILAAIIATGLMYFKAKKDYVPMYSSTATVCLMRDAESMVTPPEEDEESGDESTSPNTSGKVDVNQFANDYNIAKRVINEFTILLQKPRVKSAVRDSLSDGARAGMGSVSVSVPEDTRIIDITATATSPEYAKEIVDAYCEVGGKQVIMSSIPLEGQYTIFQEGTINTWPINGFGIMAFVKYGIIAGGLVYIIFLAMFLFDNYVRTEEDIEHYLGLSILGDIPDAFASNKRKKKYSNYNGYKTTEYGNTPKNGGKKE